MSELVKVRVMRAINVGGTIYRPKVNAQGRVTEPLVIELPADVAAGLSKRRVEIIGPVGGKGK